MLKKMLTSALFAGAVTGLIAAVLQLFFVVPVILEGELYETGQVVHFGGASVGDGTEHIEHADDHPPDADAHEHGEESSNLTRHALTILAAMATYIGYGLVLVAGIAIAARAGISVTARSGLIWGVAGFMAVQLLPAAGLPPELPGSTAADLQMRQLWWIFAVIASAGGIAAIAFGHNWAIWGAGIVVLLLPHLIGAPHPHDLAGVAPPELAGLFAGRALAVGAAAWSILGLSAGYFWSAHDR